MQLSLTEDQQREMRHAHLDGAPGILVSGLVWVAAAVVCQLLGIHQGVWTLLVGGALIYPVSAVLTKALGRPAKTGTANAMNQLGMASTIWLILCCAMAYGLYLSKPGLFFPAMMVTIGSRYLVFATMFGRTIFWTMGATLIAAGIFTLYAAIAPAFAAAAGGAIEVLFAVFVFTKPSRVAV
jgi:hypothetical protein